MIPLRRVGALVHRLKPSTREPLTGLGLKLPPQSAELLHELWISITEAVMKGVLVKKLRPQSERPVGPQLSLPARRNAAIQDFKEEEGYGNHSAVVLSKINPRDSLQELKTEGGVFLSNF